MTTTANVEMLVVVYIDGGGDKGQNPRACGCESPSTDMHALSWLMYNAANPPERPKRTGSRLDFFSSKLRNCQR